MQKTNHLYLASEEIFTNSVINIDDMSADSNTLAPVPTRATLALQKKNQVIGFQATIFEEPRGVSKQPAESIDNDEQNIGVIPQQKVKMYIDKDAQLGKDNLEFDIKKARHEVINFAINNQRQVKNKKKMQIFQAVKLGAKPPKKEYKNYKELLDERKRLKDIREQRKKFHQLGKNQAGAASVKCKGKTKLEKLQKKRAPVTSITQHYGKANPKFKKGK